MKPLSGIKIVDFTQAHAGSLATMLLADMGAEVIKIERIGVGDLARYWEPMKDNKSGYYAYLNRGKKSISINASAKEGKEIIRNLLKDADVIAENFKYGSMERMGFSYEEVMKINPRIIYASLNGFGQTGVLKNAIGLDLQLQGMGGVMNLTGHKAEPPTRVGFAFGDHTSGNYMALGILSALGEREKTGKGKKIDIGILDSVLSLLPEPVLECGMGVQRESRCGNESLDFAPCDVFQTKDELIYFEITNDVQWDKFSSEICKKEMALKYPTNKMRQDAYEAELKEMLHNICMTFSCEELLARLRNCEIPCAKVHTIAEAVRENLKEENGILTLVEDKEIGKTFMPQSSLKFKNCSTEIMEPAPLQGEHSFSYLKDLGYTASEVQTLVDKQVIEGIGVEV